MKTKIIKRTFAAAIALACILVSSVCAYAVDPKDQWGDIPDGFTFEAYPSGDPVVYATPNPAQKSGAPQENSGQSATQTKDDFNYTLEEFAAAVFTETNKIREHYGLEPLQLDPILTEIAQARMDEYIPGHKRPDGTGFWTIFNEYETSLKPTGENMSAAGGSPENIAWGFLESKGHKANIINPDAIYLGVGVKWVDTTIGPRISVVELFAK